MASPIDLLAEPLDFDEEAPSDIELRSNSPYSQRDIDALLLPSFRPSGLPYKPAYQRYPIMDRKVVYPELRDRDEDTEWLADDLKLPSRRVFPLNLYSDGRTLAGRLKRNNTSLRGPATRGLLVPRRFPGERHYEYSQRIHKYLQSQGGHLSDISYYYPWRIADCIRRVSRRRVLFAKSQVGRRRRVSQRRRWRSSSFIHC